MNFSKEKSKVRCAFDIYEHVFTTLKNSKSSQSNKHPLGHPDRVEHDLMEVEKEHLNLLRAKLDMEIAEEAKVSNENIAWKVFWLNVVLVFLTLTIAIATALGVYSQW